MFSIGFLKMRGVCVSSEPTVTCQDVRKVWAEGTKRAHFALGPLSLNIYPGEFVVLLGPSGCGKSTLLYLIAGLLEQASGRHDQVFGKQVTGPSFPRRSLIFQETSLLPWLSVGQNVSFSLSISGIARR